MSGKEKLGYRFYKCVYKSMLAPPTPIYRRTSAKLLNL